MRRKRVLKLLGAMCLGMTLVVASLLSACTSTPAEDLSVYVISANVTGDTTATVSWATDRDSTSQVEYGLTTAYGEESSLSTVLVTNHVVNLTGLTPGETYYYRVTSVDADDISATSSSKTFSTDELGISDVASGAITNRGVTITWVTDRAASSRVEYGLTNAYGSTTTLVATASNSHSAVLIGLTAETEYHYRVLSTVATDDAASPDATFTTADKVRYNTAQTDTPGTLNPLAAERTHQTMMQVPMFQTLLLKKQDGTIASSLAKTWEISGDGLTWTLELEEGVQWSDGETFNADDVIFTYETQWAHPVWAQARANASIVEVDGSGDPTSDAIVKVDDYTITFKMRDTFGTFLSSLTTVLIVPEHIWGPIVDAEDIEAYEPAGDGTELVGTGPFMFRSYVPDTSALYVVNPNSWKGVPVIDELVMQFYGSAEAALLALRAGVVDSLGRLATPTVVPLLIQEEGVAVDIISSYNNSECIWFNMRYKPFNEYGVRQAINLAIDRQYIIDVAVHGYGTMPQLVPFVGGLAESNDDLAWPGLDYIDYTLEELVAEANDILDDVPGVSAKPDPVPANWVRTYDQDGAGTAYAPVPMEYTLTIYTGPVYMRVAELIHNDLLDIGIKVDILATSSIGPLWFSGMQVWQWELGLFGYPQSADFNEMVQQWGNQPFGANYDGSVSGLLNDPDDVWTADSPPGDPDGVKPQTYDTPFAMPTADQLAEYKALYDELVALSVPITTALQGTRVIADPEERLTAILAAQQIFADVLPTAVVYHNYFLAGYRTDRFEGFAESEGGWYYGFIPMAENPETLINLTLK